MGGFLSGPKIKTIPDPSKGKTDQDIFKKVEKEDKARNAFLQSVKTKGIGQFNRPNNPGINL